MAEYIVMPKLGFDMREAELITWLKNEGDPVEKGEVIAEIESDKATLELEAQASGVLLKKLEEEGAIVAVGGNIAVVGEEGEDVSDMVGDGEGAPAEAEAAATETAAEPIGASATDVTPAPEGPSPAGNGQAAPVDGAEYPGGVKATPVARRMAEEFGIDLQEVSGSGPGGRIRKADVEAYQEAAPAETPPAPAAQPAPTPVVAEEGATEVPTSRMRQAIARRMVESKTTVPHFYVTTTVNMDKALKLRKEINEMLPDEQKVTVNDLIVKAAALALRDFPNINASFAGDKIIQHDAINVGTAVAVEGGLMTVVQKDTDTSTLSAIAADNKVMIGRAREGKVRPDDVQGATFTVSNLGAFDVENFIAIINPPEAAILAVGTAKKVPVVRDGEITIGTQMKATVSADHRVTDGAEAARFLQRFKELLEEPMRLLI
ncbi:MAG: dihydrolipoamide acetyltransferase family protein [Candidatus Promineifilaceae bacterium]|nr:dihydrolipoamide acetyltransferase family protein [Candidatus Promineifilaceae bacterium]